MNPSASTPTVVCKICRTPSPLFGVVDFSKSCLENQGKRLSLIGVPIYYRRCSMCGFLFTTAFDAWTPEGFQQNIYNDDYVIVDPEYVEIRPTNNAKFVADLFQASSSEIKLLDYGGGEGLFAQLMRERGFSADTYDPFSSRYTQMPTDSYNLITCFEVMEHVPHPDQIVETMASLLDKCGMILFTTLLQPQVIEQIGVNWWYVGPRNGHVSIYSASSLGRLFHKYGLRFGSFADSTHIAYTELPSFARNLKFAPWTPSSY
jgi:Methyltransferase domain